VKVVVRHHPVVVSILREFAVVVVVGEVEDEGNGGVKRDEAGKPRGYA